MGKIIKLKNTKVLVNVEIRNITKEWVYGTDGWFEYTYDIFVNGKKVAHFKKNDKFEDINEIKSWIKHKIINCF